MQQQKSRIPLIALISAVIIALGFPIASALNSSQISDGKYALYVSGDAANLKLGSITINAAQSTPAPTALSGKSFILAADTKDSDGKFTLETNK
ncbi:hypothetical protein [Arcanobacterium hippocoleae]|uniref:hypothetical protein n=1 Tax=Arcanobacterium hippocoleae TaxID=149017 RepID=UPI0033417AD2